MKRQPRNIRDYTDWEKEDFAEDLRTNPQYQTFFKDYTPESVAFFIQFYASHKHHLYWLKSRLYYNSDLEALSLERAEQQLRILLQKKLFNIQCLWRANLIDLPQIEYTQDFRYFEKNIFNCPFIDPITEEELAVVERFLLEEDDITDPYFEDWQDYEAFKVWDKDDDMEDDDVADSASVYYSRGTEMPDFYSYYDKCIKTSHLFNLSDIRWHKEKYYLDAIRDKNARQYALEQAMKAAEEVQEVKEEPLKDLKYYDQMDFVKTWEDTTTQELFDLEKAANSYDKDDELQDNMKFLYALRQQGEEIALLPDSDWYESIVKTVAYVKRKKAAEMLPYAYQTYMLSFDSEEEEDWEMLKAKRIANFKFDEENDGNWHRKHWIKTMAEGKALRGEDPSV